MAGNKNLEDDKVRTVACMEMVDFKPEDSEQIKKEKINQQEAAKRRSPLYLSAITVGEEAGNKALIVGVFHAQNQLLMKGLTVKDQLIPSDNANTSSKLEEIDQGSYINNMYTDVIAAIKSQMSNSSDYKYIFYAGDVNLGYSGNYYPDFLTNGSLEKAFPGQEMEIYLGSSTQSTVDIANTLAAENNLLRDKLHIVLKTSIKSPEIMRHAVNAASHPTPSASSTLKQQAQTILGQGMLFRPSVVPDEQNTKKPKQEPPKQEGPR